MKVCFYLQRRFSRLGHAIAVGLKEQYGVEKFCCYVFAKHAEKFIREQEDIEYSTILSDEELHQKAKHVKLDKDFLNKFEKEYGIPNASQFITIDRHLTMSVPKHDYSYKPDCSYEQMLKYLQVKAKAMIEMLEKEKPDAVVLSAVGSMGSLLLYHIAKKKGIQTINIEPVRIGERIALTDSCYCQFSKVEEIFQKLQKGEYESKFEKEAEDYIKESREKETRYGWVKDLMKKKKIGPIKFLFMEIKGFILHSIKHYKNSYKDYTMQSPLWFFYNKVLRLSRRLKGYKKFYTKPDLDTDFAFFPLHFEPEIATLLLSPFYTDQITLIEQIAKALPVTFKLYVKDHPAMMYFRPYSYYKRLLNIPNVELIDANFSSIKLERASKLVTTITGTAGIEAVIHKKPVLTFGSIYYNSLSMVKRVKCIEDLPEIIKDTLAHHKHDDKELKNYLAALYETSESINYRELWEDLSFDKDDMQKMLKLFARELGLKNTA